LLRVNSRSDVVRHVDLEFARELGSYVRETIPAAKLREMTESATSYLRRYDVGHRLVVRTKEIRGHPVGAMIFCRVNMYSRISVRASKRVVPPVTRAVGNV